MRKVASEHGAAGVSAQRSSTTCVDAASAVTLLDRSEKEAKALVDAHTNALVPARRLLEAVEAELRSRVVAVTGGVKMRANNEHRSSSGRNSPRPKKTCSRSSKG